MNSVHKQYTEAEARTLDNLPVIDGELIEISDEDIVVSQANNLPVGNKDRNPKTEARKTNPQFAIRNYLFLPFVFLTVTLLGGLRVGTISSDFLFLKPAVVCLIFASALLILFFAPI